MGWGNSSGIKIHEVELMGSFLGDGFGCIVISLCFSQF